MAHLLHCAAPQAAPCCRGRSRRASTLQVAASGAPKRPNGTSRRVQAIREPSEPLLAEAGSPSSKQQHSIETAPTEASTSSSTNSAPGRSSGSPRAATGTLLLLAAAGVSAVPLVLPAAAAASSAMLATIVPHSLQQHQHWQTVVGAYTAAGAASLLVSLVCTARFLVSYTPGLEEEVELRRWSLPWSAVTLFDPLLQPLRKGFFGQKEEGDLDYAAVALLAVSCSLLECLVGKDGFMNDFIPDFGLLEALQFLIFFQHGMLLPCWVIVVLRWGRVL